MPTAAPTKSQAKVLTKRPSDDQDTTHQNFRDNKHIPSSLWKAEGGREAFIAFIHEELQEAEGERSAFINKLARWKLAYKAPLAQQPKNFPIHNASNIIQSVIKEAVNTIVASLIQATMTARPWWILKSIAREWEPLTDELEVFLDTAADRDLKLSDAMIDHITELAKLGTSIISEEWDVDERKIYQYSADGGSIFPRIVVDRDGPLTKNIPLEKYWIRFTERDIQKARWCSVELQMTKQEILSKHKQGKFHTIGFALKEDEDKLRADPVKDIQDKIEMTRPTHKKRFTIHRMYVSYDLDGDDKYEEMLVYYHRDSGTLMGEFFNPYWHGQKPFKKTGYFPVEDRFYDEGLCEMLEGLQMAISETANRRADNESLANLKMFIKRRMSRGFNPGDPLYPGKVIEVSDINNDIREFQMSEIYPSTVTAEELLQTRANRISGLSEANLGSATPVSRTTAAAQLALLQEAAKRIDLTVRNIRGTFNWIGNITLQLYFQYGTQKKGLAWMGERGRVVDAAFNLPKLVSEIGLSVIAQTPTSLINKQVQRENKLSIFQLMLEAHANILPLAQQFAPDALPEVARGLVSGTRKFLTDALETFDETDPESILASLTVLEKALPQLPDLGGVAAFERGSETDQILANLARVEAISREVVADRAAERRGNLTGKPRKLSAPPGLLPSSARNLRPGGESPSGIVRGDRAL